MALPVSVETIKQQFPDPMPYSVGAALTDQYCVLGAFILSFPTCPFTREKAPKVIRFPSAKMAVLRALMYLGISHKVDDDTVDRCIRLAREITQANDDDRMKDAWKILDVLIQELDQAYQNTKRIEV